MTFAGPELLLQLADQRANGAVLCDAGTLFLRHGAVVHAESPAATGLDVLLTEGGLLSYDEWERAVTEAGARHRVARRLVETGRVPGSALEMFHLSAMYDAAYFALGGASVPRRFRRGVAHWLGPVSPVSAESLLRESRRRADLLDALWPDARLDHAPVQRREAVRPPRIPPRQRRVLDAADGSRTATGIARLLGRPAFHTLVDIRRLAAAGLVTAPQLMRRPGPGGARPAPAGGPVAGITSAEHLDVGLLRRIRDALEAKL
ncbi:transcriptional regulator [Streptomyces sp. NPDC051940]|uniref:transcriptional regulator n=1 Tax=Streptomyces sp. NPDC051940 TaxID=3155675 RepID=UPI00343D4470